MEVKDLKNHYDDILKDEDFDKLELGLKQPNIFTILRISKNEIRHSNFLAWLLDPRESHNLGDIFLKRFLREVFSSEKFEEVDQIEVEGMDLQYVEVLREWKNIDIIIKLRDVIVCIENKVLSKEHSNQLNRYKLIVQNQFPSYRNVFVYLNPDGTPSENDQDNYHPVSFEFIVESIERIISVYDNSMDQQVKNYLKDYITIIKRELMGTDKLIELSQRIYKNHRDLLDFIFEHRPEIVDDVRALFKEEIEKRGWILGSENKYFVRFYTEGIIDYIHYYKSSNGWRNRESFLFELAINPNYNRVTFKTVCSPSIDDYNPHRVVEILKEIDGFQTPTGKKWLVPFKKAQRFPIEELDITDSDSIEDFRESINKFFDKMVSVILAVESKFSEYSEELMKMNNS